MKKHKKVEEEKKKRRRREEKREEEAERLSIIKIPNSICSRRRRNEELETETKLPNESRTGKTPPLCSASARAAFFSSPFLLSSFLSLEGWRGFVAGKLFHHVAFEIEKLKDSFLSFSFFSF